MKSHWVVIWAGGFLAGEQRRTFQTRLRAIQWARQAGVFNDCKIEKTKGTR